MMETRLAGDYRGMGREQGAVLKEAGFVPPPASAEKVAFARSCAAECERHVPELLEELEGVAEGGGFERETLFALALALDAEPGCSAVALSGNLAAGGATLFGRNYDFFASFGEFAAVYETRPEGALASVGCSDVFLGREDGVNEEGVAVAMAYVGRREQRPGVMFHLAVRAILDRCRTTGEAVGFLEGIPHVRNHNFLVADRSGDLAVVEAGPRAVDVSRPDGGIAAITNHFRSERMATAEGTAGRSPDSERRLETLLGRLGSRRNRTDGRVSLGHLREILADRESGLCAEGRAADAGEPIVTLWSWTADLGNGGFRLAQGRPDRTPYEPRRTPVGSSAGDAF